MIKLLAVLLLMASTVSAADLDRQLLEQVFNQPIQHLQTYTATVTLSAYTASVDETNAEPWITANLTPSRIGLVAVSRDILLLAGLHLGQTILLPPYGAFQIQDVMHERWKMRVDILHASKKAARLFGVKENMKMVWIPWDGKTLITSMKLN